MESERPGDEGSKLVTREVDEHGRKLWAEHTDEGDVYVEIERPNGTIVFPMTGDEAESTRDALTELLEDS